MIPTNIQVEGELHRQIAVLKSQFLHIFEPDSIRYGSETGNWYGKCKHCGINLVCYTGAAKWQPFGVRRWELKLSNSVTEPEGNYIVLLMDYELFLKGKPNTILQYPDCTRGQHNGEKE